ncbi:hypothetical protein ACJJTC_005048 [Scirpophaga incertulas]
MCVPHPRSRNVPRRRLRCVPPHSRKSLSPLACVSTRALERAPPPPEGAALTLGSARPLAGITSDIPQYIIHKLGLSRDPLADLHAPPPPPRTARRPSEFHNLTHVIFSETSEERCFGWCPPFRERLPGHQLISNGAYGAVYLVKHKQTRQRYAMKKISKNNLILRNQVEQAFAEREY